MSGKHHINWLKSPSITFLTEFLKPIKSCPKRSCKGTCVEVLCRYFDHGVIHKEYECTTCGKIIKDYRAIEKDNQWQQQNNNNRRRNNRVNNSRTSRFRNNNSTSK